MEQRVLRYILLQKKIRIQKIKNVSAKKRSITVTKVNKRRSRKIINITSKLLLFLNQVKKDFEKCIYIDGVSVY